MDLRPGPRPDEKITTQLASLDETIEPSATIANSFGEVAVRFADVATIVAKTIG